MVDLSQVPRHAGVVHRRTLLAEGYSDREIRTAIDDGDLNRVYRGSYAPGRADAASPADRYRLCIRAVAERSTDLVVSHVSAAALYRLPLWRLDTASVHVTRPGVGGAAKSSRRTLHSAALETSDVRIVDGLQVTTPARTLMDLARSVPFESAVIAIDNALHRRIVSMEMLARAICESDRRPGMRAARRALAFADGRAERPGESRTRVLIHRQGLPAPELQIEVFDRDGSLIGRTDLGYPADAALIEFDGKVKYRKPFIPGMTAADVVEAERAREIAIGVTGAGLTRVIWKELDFPAGVVGGILHAQAIGRATVSRRMLACTMQPLPAIRLPLG